MLFYEKRRKQKMKVLVPSEEKETQILNKIVKGFADLPVQEVEGEKYVEPDFNAFTKYVSNADYLKVHADNQKHLFEKHILHDSFSKYTE